MKTHFFHIVLPMLFFFTSITAQIQQFGIPIQQTPCYITSVSLGVNETYNIFFDNNTRLLNYTVANFNANSNISIHIISMLGEYVYSTGMLTSEQNLFKGTIRLPSIKKGMYFVMIQAGNNAYAKKIIVI